MKKRALRKNVRQRMITILFFLLVMALAGLYWSLTRPAETEEQYTAFTYSQEAEIDYQVYLKPNELFTEPFLEAGRAYISALTDSVDTQFTYRFEAEEEAGIRGQYSVIASIKAAAGEENHAVWEKSYMLLPLQRFYVQGKDVLLEENIAFPFAEYAAYADEIMKQTGYIPDKLNLVVSYDVALFADTSHGVIEESMSPKMIIPLKGNVFTVGGNLSEKNTGEIEAVKHTAVLYYKEAQIGFGLLTAMLVLLLVAVMQMTVDKEEKNYLVKKKIARILKKHGERVVRCTETVPVLNPQNIVPVGAFEDIVKAADELEKPILYYRTGEEEHAFLVISQQYVYRYSFGALSSATAGNVSPRSLVKNLR